MSDEHAPMHDASPPSPDLDAVRAAAIAAYAAAAGPGAPRPIDLPPLARTRINMVRDGRVIE